MCPSVGEWMRKEGVCVCVCVRRGGEREEGLLFSHKK